MPAQQPSLDWTSLNCNEILYFKVFKNSLSSNKEDESADYFFLWFCFKQINFFFSSNLMTSFISLIRQEKKKSRSMQGFFSLDFFRRPDS